MASIETSTSGWFCHKDARRKREEITRLIRQTSEVARAAGLVERGPSQATENSKLQQETERKKTSIEDMKVPELQAALKARGLKRSGKKSDLVLRLQSSLEAETETSSQCLPRKRKLMLESLPYKKQK